MRHCHLFVLLGVSAASANRLAIGKSTMRTDFRTLDSNLKAFKSCDELLARKGYRDLQDSTSVVLKPANGTSHTLQLGECVGGGAFGIVFHLVGLSMPAIVKFYESPYERTGFFSWNYAPHQFQITRDMLGGPLSAPNKELAARGEAAMTQPLLAGDVSQTARRTWHTQVWSAAPGLNLKQIFALSPEELDPQFFSHVGFGLFAALYYLGSKGMWHNDLQPSNIMWNDEDGAQTLSIIDFGGLSSAHNPMSPMDKQSTDLTKCLGVLHQIAQRIPPFLSPDGAEMRVLPMHELQTLRQGLPPQLAPDKKSFIEGSAVAEHALQRKLPNVLPAYKLMVAAHKINRKTEPDAYLIAIEKIAEMLETQAQKQSHSPLEVTSDGMQTHSRKSEIIDIGNA